MGGRDRKSNFLILYLGLLEFLAGGWWSCEAEYLFRAGWILTLCIHGFENVGPRDGSGWVKETHCVCKSRMEIVFCFGFIIFSLLFSVMNIEQWSSEIRSNNSFHGLLL